MVRSGTRSCPLPSSDMIRSAPRSIVTSREPTSRAIPRRPRASETSSVRSACCSASLLPPPGSSTISSLGSRTSARASARRVSASGGSSCGAASTNASAATCTAASRAFESASDTGVPVMSRGSAMWSSIGLPGAARHACVCATNAISRSRRVRSRRGSSATGRPHHVTAPLSGSSIPAAIRSSVVFPLRRGPRRPTYSSRPRSKEIASSTASTRRPLRRCLEARSTVSRGAALAAGVAWRAKLSEVPKMRNAPVFQTIQPRLAGATCCVTPHALFTA